MNVTREPVTILDQLEETHGRTGHCPMCEAGPSPHHNPGCPLPALLAVARAAADKAKTAKSIATAPDYDEEAIRDALWALVDAVLTEVAPLLRPAEEAK